MEPAHQNPTPPDRSARRALLLVALGAASLRALISFGLLSEMPMVSDARSYAEQGLALLRDGWPAHPFYWPPGISFLVAAAHAVGGPGPGAPRILLVLVGTATTVAAAVLAGRLARPALLPAGLLAAAYMPAVLLSGQTYSQHLAALCLGLVALLGLVAWPGGRCWAYGAMGLALGLGCITRPSMVSLLPALAVVGLMGLRDRARRTERLLGAGLLAAGMAMPVVPVMLHNHARGAGLTLSTNNERNFFLGNNPYTHPYKTSHLAQRPLSQLPPQTRAYLESFYRRPDARAAMRREAQRHILADPLGMLQRTWNRALSFWGFDYLASRLIQRHFGLGRTGLAAFLALEAGAYLGVMLLALLALLCPPEPMDRGVLLWLLLLVLAYQLPYLLAFSGGTYHFPVMVLVLPLAGVTLGRLLQPGGAGALWQRLRRRPLVWAVLAFFVLVQLQYAYHAIALES